MRWFKAFPSRLARTGACAAASLMLALAGCATPKQSPGEAPAGAINWVMGEYTCGAKSSPFGTLHLALEKRFVLSRRNAKGGLELVTGQVRTKAGRGEAKVRWVDLIPDQQFAGQEIPKRLYVTQGNDYQVLATHPFSPSESQGKPLPAGYLHFYDSTSPQTRARYQEILTDYERGRLSPPPATGPMVTPNSAPAEPPSPAPTDLTL